MDAEVVEIDPPRWLRSTSRSRKQKEVVRLCEVIDVDIDQDSSDVMIIDEKVGSSYKGKAAINGPVGSSDYKYKDALAFNFSSSINVSGVGSMDAGLSSKEFASMSRDSNLVDCVYDLSNEEDDWMDVDEYARLQSYFDNVDVPPGVEAFIPWPSDSFQSKKKQSSCNLVLQPRGESFHEVEPSLSCRSSGHSPSYMQKTSSCSSWVQVDAATSNSMIGLSLPLLNAKQKPHSSKFQIPNGGGAHVHSVEQNKSLVLKQQIPYALKHFDEMKKKRKAGASTTNPADLNPKKVDSGLCAKKPYVQNKMKQQILLSNSTDPLIHMPLSGQNLPLGLDTSMSWWQSSLNLTHTNVYSSFDNPIFLSTENTAAAIDTSFSSRSSTSQQNISGSDELLKKFEDFKHFDTVDDHSDHHYAHSRDSVKQPTKSWSKRIQEEWRILEKDLPDTIYVRVYETRMDLLRAVIVGAEGTPYHDGLFFFDVLFPSGYPRLPPHVHYHSGGLRLNPNLYNCGKVCLSLLNTWSGSGNEKWISGVSTMLQVLVSIQGLILNAKPYFNEPGFASLSGSVSGEKRSLEYNESTLILSLKTMLYTIRRPPMHFNDFVAGHFCKHAHDILGACRAYTEGAQVGCLVKGGVQDVDSGGHGSCSDKFKRDVGSIIQLLVQAFEQAGYKDTEKYLSLGAKGCSNQVDSMGLTTALPA